MKQFFLFSFLVAMLTSLSAAEGVEVVNPSSYQNDYFGVGNKILSDLDAREAEEKVQKKEDAYIKPTMVKRAVVDFFVKPTVDPYQDLTPSKQQANVERARIAEYKARQDLKAAEVRLRNVGNKGKQLQFQEEKARAQVMHDAIKSQAIAAKEKLTQEKAILKQFKVVARLEKNLNTALALDGQRATVEQARLAAYQAQQKLSVAEERLRNAVENRASGDERVAAQKEYDAAKKQANATNETFVKETAVVTRLSQDLQGAESDPQKALKALNEATSKGEALIKSGRDLDAKAKSASVEVKKLQQADKKIQKINKQLAKLEEEKRALKTTSKTTLQHQALDDKIAQLKERKVSEEKAFKPKVPARPSRPVTSVKGSAPAIPARSASMQKQEVKPVDAEALKRRLDEKQKIHDDLQEQKSKAAARLKEINNKIEDPKLNRMDRVDLGIEKSRLMKEASLLDEKLQAAKADLDGVQKEVAESERVRQLDEKQKAKSSKLNVQEENILKKLIDDPLPAKKELRSAEHMTEERKARILENYKKKQALERPVAVQTKDIVIDNQDPKAEKVFLSVKNKIRTPAEMLADAEKRETERAKKLIAEKEAREAEKAKADKKIVRKGIKKVKALVPKLGVRAKPTTARVIAH